MQSEWVAVGLKDFYYSLEDKYYAFLDWLDAKGLHVYKIVDPLEARHIPSFPVAVLLLLVIVGGIAWLATGGAVLGGTAQVNLTVTDESDNPLPNVSVSLFYNNQAKTQTTSELGRVSFDGIPAGIPLEVKIQEPGFKPQTIPLTATSNVVNQLIVLEADTTTKTVSIQLLKQGTSELITQPVELRFSCSNDPSFNVTKTSSNGTVSLEVPLNCGVLYANSLDAQYTNAQSAVDMENNQPTLFFQEGTPQGTGIVRVFVVDELGNPVSGLKVLLKGQYGNVVTQGYTTSAGSVEFTSIVPDSYLVSTFDDQGNYAAEESALQSVGDIPVTFNITVKKTNIGEVRVQLVDEATLQPISNATAALYKGNSLVATKYSDAQGKVSFGVSSNAGLSLAIDHADYLKASVTASVSVEFVQVKLVKATSDNSQTFTVKVVDELNQPVEGAQVKVKKSPSGQTVGVSKTTGASGSVTFNGLEAGSYFASAVKPGFADEKVSNVVVIEARKNVEAVIQLVIGQGTLFVQVTDETGNPLPAASVSVFDFYTSEQIGEAYSLESDGTRSISLRADKKVFVRAKESEHLDYTTIAIQIQKDVAKEIGMGLVKSVSKLEVRLVKVLSNSGELFSDSALEPGQLYTLKLQLLLPKNSQFSETGMHVRTGAAFEGLTNILENDYGFIRDIRAASSSMQRGTSYTPPLGFSIDGQHLTNGDSKWADIRFKPPAAQEGVVEVEMDLQVKDGAPIGAELPLFFRGWGRVGTSYVRFPADSILGSAESTPQKQGLYANANSRIFTVGPNATLCAQGFCVALSVEDTATGIQTGIATDFEAGIGSAYKLLFTITSQSDAVLSDAQLVLSNSAGGLKLKEYNVTDSTGGKKTGNAGSSSSVSIPIGSVALNSVVFGSINLETVKDGSNKFTLQILSNKKEAFKKEIFFNVAPAKELNVEIIPKTIVPFINNNVLVKVEDVGTEEPVAVENASVSVKLNENPVTTGSTNSDGLFSFELIEPDSGSTLSVEVEKTGFKKFVKTVVISSDLLVFNPPALNVNLILNLVNEKEQEFGFTNAVDIPLKVKSVEFTGDVESNVAFELLSQELLGQEFGLNQDANAFVSFKLTEKGKKLLKPKQFKTNLALTLENAGLGKTLIANLPVLMKIGFAGSVDDASCLIADPGSWNIFTDAKEAKTLSFTLKNTCTVKNEPVALREISAKVKFVQENEVGSFSALTADSTKELGAEFKLLLDEIPAKGEGTVTLTFTPFKVNSGTNNPLILFEAKNITNTGADVLNVEVKTSAVVNHLKQCVVVKTQKELVIQSCPLNTGYSGYGQFSSQYSPLNGFGYQNNGQLGYNGLYNNTSASGANLYGLQGYNALANQIPNPKLSGIPQITNQTYPYVDRYSQYYDTLNLNPANSGFYFCGTTEFRVENTCTSDVEINLQVDPSLQVGLSNFTLQPNADKRVSVQSAYRIGRYPIIIEAKSKGSTDGSKEIEQLFVLVQSPNEVNADCIQLDRTKFKFGPISPEPISGKVYNNCYDQGVRIVQGSAIRITAAFDPGTSPQSSFVRNVIEEPTTTNSDGGKTIQVLRFRIIPDYEKYKKLGDDVEPGNVFKDILDLRFLLYQGYYTVESQAIMTVQFFDAFGQRQAKAFNVVFEDLLKSAQFVESAERGDPSVTNFQDCIEPESLTSTLSGAPLEFDDLAFAGKNTFTYTPPVPGRRTLKIGGKGCGTTDSISGLKPATLTTPEGVSATFSLADHAHNVQVKVTRPPLLDKDVKVETKVRAKVSRPLLGYPPQDVEIPVQFTVKATGTGPGGIGGKPPIGLGIDKAPTCDTGSASLTGTGKALTSQAAYDGLGFNHLAFDWDWDETEKEISVCDATNADGSPNPAYRFCDSTQFFIELNEKAAQVKEFVATNNKALLGPYYSSTWSLLTEGGNALNLYRYVKKRVTVPGDTKSNPDQVYFVTSNNTPVLAVNAQLPSSDALQNLKNITSGGVTAGNQKAIVQAVQQAAAEFAKYEDFIIAVNYPESTDMQTDSAFAALGAKYSLVGSPVHAIHYYWTATKFKELHDRLFNAVNKTENAVDAEIEKIKSWNLLDDSPYLVKKTSGEVDNDKIKVTTELLQKIYENISFAGIALRDKEVKDMTEEEIRKAITQAADTEPLDFEDNAYNNLEDLYFNAVKFESHLMKDGYSADFRADFKKQYSSVKTIGEWKDSTYTLEKTGRYPVTVDYAWKENKFGEGVFDVQVKKDKAKDLAEIDKENAAAGTITAYANNAFLSLPFNGEVGVESSGTGTRTGYGLAFNVTQPGVALVRSETKGYLAKVDGSTVFAVNYALEFEEVNTPDGKGSALLGVNASTLRYAPNVPVPLKATAGVNGQIGMEYVIAPNGSFGNESSYKGATPLRKAMALRWQDCSNASHVKADKQGYFQECGTSARLNDRFVEMGSNNTFTYSAIAFVPEAEYESTSFKLVCGVQQAQVSHANGSVSAGVQGQFQVGSNEFVLHNSKISEAPRDVVSIIERLKDSTACVRATPSEMSFEWNLGSADVLDQTLTCFGGSSGGGSDESVGN